MAAPNLLAPPAAPMQGAYNRAAITPVAGRKITDPRYAAATPPVPDPNKAPPVVNPGGDAFMRSQLAQMMMQQQALRGGGNAGAGAGDRGYWRSPNGQQRMQMMGIGVPPPPQPAGLPPQPGMLPAMPNLLMGR